MVGSLVNVPDQRQVTHQLMIEMQVTLVVVAGGMVNFAAVGMVRSVVAGRVIVVDFDMVSLGWDSSMNCSRSLENAAVYIDRNTMVFC